MSLPVTKDLAASIAATRFGLGAKPGELETARSDPQGWLLEQVRVSGADQPAGDLPDTRHSLEMFRAYRQQVQAQKQAESAADAARPKGAPAQPTMASMTGGPMTAAPVPAMAAAPVDPTVAARRAARAPLREEVQTEILARTQLGATTPAGFRERWALFWANHFTVSSNKFAAAALVGPFEREAIRPHVFGRFEDLLVASSMHPGMLLYLDQAQSIGPDSLGGRRRQAGLNENLGREILELHTVGADAGYTQADVTEFARALTGWSVTRQNEQGVAEGAFYWRPQIHEPGQRTVMGQRYADEGYGQARRILTTLAAHPKTAQRLSRKIAVHFVADDPPPELVEALNRTWTSTHGDLAQVAKTLIQSPHAWAPAQAKFKTPNEFVLSAWRAANASPQAPQDVVGPLTQFGQRPFAAPQPNGWSEEAGYWASGAAMVRRLGWSSQFAAQHAPTDAPVQMADAALGARTTPALKTALERSESRNEAFALLLMSPEFQRR